VQANAEQAILLRSSETIPVFIPALQKQYHVGRNLAGLLNKDRHDESKKQ